MRAGRGGLPLLEAFGGGSTGSLMTGFALASVAGVPPLQAASSSTRVADAAAMTGREERSIAVLHDVERR